MNRLVCLETKDEAKARIKRQKQWKREQRDLHAQMLRGLRNGTFRPWERFI